jgi:hypothetical protein
MAGGAIPGTGDGANQEFIGGAPLRAGQFTVGWQIMLAASWTAAFFAFVAVWKTSQEIGIGTWWLGARAQPQPTVLRLAPFALTLFVGILALSNVPRTAWISAVASIAIAVGAAFDMSRSGGLAAIEFAIAGSMMLVSIGAMLGATRRPATG